MPSIAENRRQWQEVHDWTAAGEQWSEIWGGSASQWSGTILPRIRTLLPGRRVLEIGCGFGRWSRRLRAWSDELVLVDLAPRCVEACRSQFAGDAGVRCFETDGSGLPGVETASVDFAFSFDSLVHAEIDVVRAYARELARTLSARGAAFLHHSNMAEAMRSQPGLANRHWRGESVSAELVREAVEGAGLACARQEIVDWGGVEDGDCFTTVVRRESPLAKDPVVLRNPHFMGEAQSLAVRARLYGDSGGGESTPDSASRAR